MCLPPAKCFGTQSEKPRHPLRAHLRSPRQPAQVRRWPCCALRWSTQNAIALNDIVLAVPFLTVIEQTACIYQKVFADFPGNFVLEHHSLAGLGEESERQDAEGAQERQRRLLTENWDAPIVLTTNVQLLESLFSNRPSACRKLHRLMESVILFDEAQSLPQHLAVPTLAALSHLSHAYCSSVVFATATQPAFDALHEAVAKQAVSGWKPAEIAPGHPELFKTLKRVHVRWPRNNEKTNCPDLAAPPMAITELDFVEIAKRYRLIDQNTFQLLVPWNARLGDFKALRAEAESEGISASWMRRAQGLAVSVYRPHDGMPAWAIPARLKRFSSASTRRRVGGRPTARPDQVVRAVLALDQAGMDRRQVTSDHSSIVEGALTTTHPSRPSIFIIPSLNFACSCVARVQSHRKLTIRASLYFASAR